MLYSHLQKTPNAAQVSELFSFWQFPGATALKRAESTVYYSAVNKCSLSTILPQFVRIELFPFPEISDWLRNCRFWMMGTGSIAALVALLGLKQDSYRNSSNYHVPDFKSLNSAVFCCGFFFFIQITFYLVFISDIFKDSCELDSNSSFFLV